MIAPWEDVGKDDRMMHMAACREATYRGLQQLGPKKCRFMGKVCPHKDRHRDVEEAVLGGAMILAVEKRATKWDIGSTPKG